jgi:molecular chaperone DnaK (HSP70)
MSVTIGIDFGTSFCSASWINPITGNPEAVRFSDTGTEKMPSIVAFTSSDEIRIGNVPYQALEDAASADEDMRRFIQENTITGIKTRMKYGDQYRRKSKTYSNDEIIAEILKKIKQQVIESCNITDKIDQAVLTHPVVFEEWKKDCLKHAAALAGFKRVKTLEEPISAALYAIKSGAIPKTCKGLLVYDFGAGTFDVAYVKIESDGDLHLPLTPLGDSNCGGDDIDMALYRNWEKYIKTTKGKSISTDPEEIDLAFLYRCRRQKEQLSRGQMADVINAYIPRVGSIRREFSDADFNKIVEPWVDKTIEKTRQLVNEIQAKKLPLDYAVLIGGSSRLPLVKKKMETLLGNSTKVVTTGGLDIAVAVGAMYSISTPITKEKPKKEPPKPTPPVEYFCTNCGNKIMSNVKFCMVCGQKNYMYKP